MTFQGYEDKGRQKFEGICHKPHEYTKGMYDKWDVSVTADTDTFNLELKDRDIPFEKYAHKGFLLERIKFDALLAAYRETGSKPIYMNFFQEGVGMWWNLLEVEPVWKVILCTDTTADGTYGNKKVDKEVVLLSTESGRKFRYGA